MHLNSFCFVLTGLPVCISLALNYFQNKILFSEKLSERGDFQSACRGAILQKWFKTTGTNKREIPYKMLDKENYSPCVDREYMF